MTEAAGMSDEQVMDEQVMRQLAEQAQEHRLDPDVFVAFVRKYAGESVSDAGLLSWATSPMFLKAVEVAIRNGDLWRLEEPAEIAAVEVAEAAAPGVVQTRRLFRGLRLRRRQQAGTEAPAEQGQAGAAEVAADDRWHEHAEELVRLRDDLERLRRDVDHHTRAFSDLDPGTLERLKQARHAELYAAEFRVRVDALVAELAAKFGLNVEESA